MVNIDKHNDHCLAMKDFDEHDREVIDEIVKMVVENRKIDIDFSTSLD